MHSANKACCATWAFRRLLVFSADGACVRPELEVGPGGGYAVLACTVLHTSLCGWPYVKSLKTTMGCVKEKSCQYVSRTAGERQQSLVF